MSLSDFSFLVQNFAELLDWRYVVMWAIGGILHIPRDKVRNGAYAAFAPRLRNNTCKHSVFGCGG